MTRGGGLQQRHGGGVGCEGPLPQAGAFPWKVASELPIPTRPSSDLPVYAFGQPSGAIRTAFSAYCGGGIGGVGSQPHNRP